MKVIIVGGGISGLSVYSALRTHFEIDTIAIYENHHESSSSIGGGLGLAPNGLRAISHFSPAAVTHIQTNGLNRSILTFRNSLGTFLGHYWNGTKERYGFSQVLLPRQIVHQALKMGVSPEDIHWGKKVVALKELANGVQVEFQDGHVELADIVIGADGVRSVVREAICSEVTQAEYEGYCGIGGFLPTSNFSPEFRLGLAEHPVTMTFGSEGFFGYSLIAEPSTQDTTLVDNRIMWWSTYKTDTPPTRTGAELSSIREHLISIHGDWKSPHDTMEAPVFRSIISSACGSEASLDDILILPRYLSPPLDHWTGFSSRVFLVGDAAHALPPDAGQGVAAAVEDALALADLLKHALASDGSAINEQTLYKVAQAYEEIRMPRLAQILAIAKRRSGNKKMKSWWAELMRDWMLWLLCKLPERVNDKMFAYDIKAEVARYVSRVV